MLPTIGNRVMELPPELVPKAQTLGGNADHGAQVVLHRSCRARHLRAAGARTGVAVPDRCGSHRSTEGLGYRIFLVRRYLSMDVILPYVAWITLLAVITDWLLVRLSHIISPWAHPVQNK